MQTKPTPAEGNDSAKLKAESALRDAACCASFTPPPWRVGNTETVYNDEGDSLGVGFTVHSAGSGRRWHVATVFGQVREDLPLAAEQGYAEHNARLIAAAPELLEAMMAIEERYIDGCDTYEDWKFMGDTARAALHFLHNVKRIRPYQRGRKAITGWRL